MSKFVDPRNIDQTLYENLPLEGLSTNKYAAHRKAAGLPGVSFQSIKKATEAGKIRKNKYGKFDPKIADMDWFNNTDPCRNPQINQTLAHSTNNETRILQEIDFNDGVIPEYAESRARNEFAKARLGELKVQEQEGMLVNKHEAYAELFNLYRVIRDRFLALPVTLAPLVIGMDDLSDVEAEIEKKIVIVLEELSAEGRKLNLENAD